MLNAENSVVCMIEAQSAEIIRTANAFKSKSYFKLLGIVNNGFGPSNSENSDNKMKSCSKTAFPHGWVGNPSAINFAISPGVIFYRF